MPGEKAPVGAGDRGIKGLAQVVAETQLQGMRYAIPVQYQLRLQEDQRDKNQQRTLDIPRQAERGKKLAELRHPGFLSTALLEHTRQGQQRQQHQQSGSFDKRGGKIEQHRAPDRGRIETQKCAQVVAHARVVAERIQLCLAVMVMLAPG